MRLFTVVAKCGCGCVGVEMVAGTELTRREARRLKRILDSESVEYDLKLSFKVVRLL